MIKQFLDKNWKLRCQGEPEQPAVVPGTVYTDLLRNGRMEDPFWKDNELRALPLMENDYEYEVCFDISEELMAQDRILLHFDGLDTIADVYVNQEWIGRANNMHRVWEFDVTELLRKKENVLRIVLHSPLRFIREEFAKCRTLGSEDAMDGFVHMRKAHCMFGWDWGAHLPDAGIFRSVVLLGVKMARLDSVYIRQEHADGNVVLHLEVTEERFPNMISCSDKGEVCDMEAVCSTENIPHVADTFYVVEIEEPDRTIRRYQASPKEILIEHPKLWWPNGYGSQPLYNVKVTLYGDGSL